MTAGSRQNVAIPGLTKQVLSQTPDIGRFTATWSVPTSGRALANLDCERPAEQVQAGIPLQHERGVRATEPERVRQRDVDLALLGLVGNEIQRRRNRGIVEIDRRRHDVVANGERGKDRLDGAGRAQQMTDRRFRRGHRRRRLGLAQQPLDSAELDLVAHRRRGAVGVDVVDVLGREASALESRLHAAETAVAVFGRRRDVIGIARHAIADDLGIDARAAPLGVLEILQHDDPGAFAHDEPVAILVVGARALRRRIVEARRERARRAKAGDGDPADRAFRATGDHHVGIAQRDQPAGIADRMRAGRARRHDGVIGPLELMLDRDVARRQIDQAARNEERADPAGALSPSAGSTVSAMPARPPMPEPIRTPVRSCFSVVSALKFASDKA